MKSQNSSVLAILATGQFAKADLWEITLVAPIATTLYLTNWDTNLTVGGHTYDSGFGIKRGSLTHTNNLSVSTLDVTLTPQFDSPTPVKVGSYSVTEALRRGFFDGATVKFSKLFMQTAGDVSAGAVPWFIGRVANVKATRASVTMTVESALALLNVAMPRNVYQTGCLHALFDAGCTLTKASFKSSGAISGSPTSLTNFVYTGLSQATGYFDLGIVVFTSGKNTGVSRTVKIYGLGNLILASPLPEVPASGDTFDIYPGCDKTQDTCNTKFSNILHFRGYPYIPVPETQYDGGTYNPQVFTDGQQGRSVAGSSTNANRFAGSYVR
jgi:uncharacterized phage protein (TIGR02218 family)